MRSGSLRLRLLVAAMLAVFVALAVSGLALTLLFERHIERRAETDLTRVAQQLVAALSLDAGGVPLADAKPSDPRFSQPGSGLYWQLRTSMGALKSPSLFDQSLASSAAAMTSEWRVRIAAGPFESSLLIVERVVRPNRSSPPVLVQVAQDRRVIKVARQEFSRDLGQYLLVLWLVLCLAAWLQVHLGLRPLRRLRSELASLQRDPGARLTSDHPSEVSPLTQAINQLADTRERDLEFARRRAADLAHGLKTPLAALAAQSRKARAAGAGEAADGLDRAIEAAGAAVNAELARSRVAHVRATASRVESSARVAVERVVGVVERIDFGRERVFEVEVPADLQLPLAAEDLTELLGSILENAARHARRVIRIHGETVQRESGAVHTLIVDDDGAGLRPELMGDAIRRGVRADESGPGHGLGLAIARELAEASGGALSLQPAPLGGLRVTMEWPRAN